MNDAAGYKGFQQLSSADSIWFEVILTLIVYLQKFEKNHRFKWALQLNNSLNSIV